MEMIRNDRIDFLILNFRKYSNSLSISDEGYSRNVLCTLNLISMFLFTHLLPILFQSVPKTFSKTSPGGKSGPTIHQPSLILTSPNKIYKLCYEESAALPSWQVGRCWNILSIISHIIKTESLWIFLLLTTIQSIFRT